MPLAFVDGAVVVGSEDMGVAVGLYAGTVRAPGVSLLEDEVVEAWDEVLGLFGGEGGDAVDYF